jgi:hypothetical protein
MRSFKYFLILVLIILGLGISGCWEKHPEKPWLGIDESVVLDGVRLTIIEARIQTSYSTYYIMHYPAENYLFYGIKASIEGFDDPKSALEWGKENIRLVLENQEYSLAYARWSIFGEDIQYKADEDYNYHYFFIFNIPRDSDYSMYSLQIHPDHLIETSLILQSNLFQVSGGSDDVQDDMIDKYATVGGGTKNISSAYYTTISGGNRNTASSAYSFIGGGRENTASNFYASVSGGYGNTASGRDSSIGGGSRNTASNHHVAIGGGIQNRATASDSTIAGGAYNLADQPYAVVSGGYQNVSRGTASVVGGGAGNFAANNQSTVSGGLENQATGIYAVVGGGYGNKASGEYGAVPGGALNQSGGNFSFAAGYRSVVKSTHAGAFLFADSTDADFYSVKPNEFGVRATGGIRFVTAVDGQGEPSAGVILPEGSGAWSNLSDRHMKENIVRVDQKQILESALSLEITEWNYSSQDPAIRHIGPMASDFYAAFGLGEDEHHISSIDADGINLVAIQGLYQLLNEQNDQITALEGRISSMEKQANITSLLFVLSSIGLFAATGILLRQSFKQGYLDQPYRLVGRSKNETNLTKMG